MNFIFSFIASFIQQAACLLLDVAKIELATLYLKGLGHIRRVFIVGLFFLFAVLLCVSGFLIIHVALFMVLPWSLLVKALCLLGLGLVYLLVPLFLILRFCSQRGWMKVCQADKLIDELKIGKV